MSTLPFVSSSIVPALAGGWFLSGTQPPPRLGEASTPASSSDTKTRERSAVVSTTWSSGTNGCDENRATKARRPSDSCPYRRHPQKPRRRARRSPQPERAEAEDDGCEIERKEDQ